MCINYMHGDRFLIIWEAFFVQCSYAMLLLLQSGSSHKQTAADRFIDNVDCGRDSAGLRVSAVGIVPIICREWRNLTECVRSNFLGVHRLE
ncbi:hypothetical protein [Sinorhizobium medicae]|nr:hypothetical protein [Sinorhizobium medicae]